MSNLKFTKQQQDIINYITKNKGLVKVNAISGAGKTSLLVGIAEALQPNNGMYLAYNKAIATESKKKFNKVIDCRTTHSLAYQYTIRQENLWLGYFSYKDIKEPLPYEIKAAIVDYIREFCLSEFTDIKDFTALIKGLKESQVNLMIKYMNMMSTGEIQCTHDFYLKYFHIKLATVGITYSTPFDLLMLDESGDLNPVTLEIFKLLPATRKVMVGDQNQNIYTFNHTINCFKEMENEGKIFPMTQSFRVAEHIADRVEKFCKRFINKDMEFRGVPNTDKNIKTRAFISRTNGQLVAKMMELNDLGIQYTLTRPTKSIFRVPLMVCGLGKNKKVYDPEYSYLTDDLNEYYNNPDLQSNMSLVVYLKEKYDDNVPLQSAITLVQNHGRKAIMECFEEAKKHEKMVTNYTLCSAHSSKGLEFDEVEIGNDLNKAVENIITSILNLGSTDHLNEIEKAELNLYYVACTRSKKVLRNASYL